MVQKLHIAVAVSERERERNKPANQPTNHSQPTQHSNNSNNNNNNNNNNNTTTPDRHQTIFDPSSGLARHWEVPQTVSFLKRKGFDSYADHFEKEAYNGLNLVAVEKEDIDGMPETRSLKRKCFLGLVQSLQG